MCPEVAPGVIKQQRLERTERQANKRQKKKPETIKEEETMKQSGDEATDDMNLV
jgi:hypothetical protein